MQGRYLKYTWDKIDTSALCTVQTVANGGGLVFNGKLAYTGINQINFVDYLGYSRTLTLSSPNNLSAVQFHITGIQNGGTVSEIINGPNATTIDTPNFFDVVTSITVSGGNATNISVGIGAAGGFKLIGSNSNKPASVSVIFHDEAQNAKYEIYYIPSKIEGNGIKLADLSSYLFPFVPPTTASGTYQTEKNYYYLFCLIESQTTATDPIVDFIYYEPK